MNAEKIHGENVYVNLDEVIETVYQCRRDEANDEWVKRWFEPLASLPTLEVSEDCISVEDIGKTLNEWLADKEMAKFATKVLRLNAPRAIPTTEQSSKVGE